MTPKEYQMAKGIKNVSIIYDWIKKNTLIPEAKKDKEGLWWIDPEAIHIKRRHGRKAGKKSKRKRSKIDVAKYLEKKAVFKYCSNCNGKGVVLIQDSAEIQKESPCKNCEGTGKLWIENLKEGL